MTIKVKDLEKEINNVKNKINNIDLDENFKEELNQIIRRKFFIFQNKLWQQYYAL